MGSLLRTKLQRSPVDAGLRLFRSSKFYSPGNNPLFVSVFFQNDVFIEGYAFSQVIESRTDTRGGFGANYWHQLRRANLSAIVLLELFRYFWRRLFTVAGLITPRPLRLHSRRLYQPLKFNRRSPEIASLCHCSGRLSGIGPGS